MPRKREVEPNSEEWRARKRVYRARWEAKNPEYRHAHYEKNKVAIKARHKAWRLAHLAETRAWQSEYGRKMWAEAREKVFAHYGKQCKCCGESQEKFLCVDHINGGGNKHKREIGGNTWEWLVKNNFPPEFQILCHNCNMAKGFYGSCPHNGN